MQFTYDAVHNIAYLRFAEALAMSRQCASAMMS